MSKSAPKYLKLTAENVTITLTKPTELNGIKVDTITLRAPTVRDMRISSQTSDGDDEPVAKIGREAFYDTRAVLDNRLQHQSGKQQPGADEIDPLIGYKIDCERLRLTKEQAEAFQVALLNAMGNDLIQELNLIKSARVGYTKMLVANIAYKLEHKKRSVCMWSPTDGDAEGIMKEHIEPMIRDVPVIKAMAPWLGKKHKHNTIESKTFENRKVLWWMGGKAGGNYREKSPDEVGYDELSSFDDDIDKEGSPTFLGDKRLEGATYPKSIRGSTPKLAGSCQISRAAEESPYLLRFHIRCPHCQTEQTLKWGGSDEPYGLKWSKDELGQVDHAWYLCESGNGCTFEHYEMVEASKAGRYICEKTGIWTRDSMEWFGANDKPIRTPLRVTFHIWTIYSTFTTWVKIAD